MNTDLTTKPDTGIDRGQHRILARSKNTSDVTRPRRRRSAKTWDVVLFATRVVCAIVVATIIVIVATDIISIIPRVLTGQSPFEGSYIIQLGNHAKTMIINLIS